MKLSQFRYNLPDELIAQYPSEDRDGSRLMVLHKDTGEIDQMIFKDIVNLYHEGDLMVFNDTKIFPSVLYGIKEKNGATIEVFLLRELSSENHLWDVLVEPARKIRIGNKLYFGEDSSLVAEVIDNTTSRGRTLRFLTDEEPDVFREKLFALGTTPLPQYIHRPPEPSDAERYQTIFAKYEGAVMAPAAGLHFSPQLMKRLEIKGVKESYLTVHCGLGNFRAIDVEDLSKHRMDSEQIEVNSAVVEAVNKTHDDGKQICAVGTSTLRAMVAASSVNGHLKTYAGWANKFIYPPFEFTVATSLISNFHLPYSSMLMMVAAFGGYDNVMHAYELAVKEKYRFGVYGDALLII